MRIVAAFIGETVLALGICALVAVGLYVLAETIVGVWPELDLRWRLAMVGLGALVIGAGLVTGSRP